jgi:CDP-diacylglycerol--glycerol-3-phosphate 3-phosphatidyltransferase
MLSRWIRTWYSSVLRPFLNILARLGITANMLTVASLLVAIIAGILFASGKAILGAWILLFAGFLDGIDGELARVHGIKSSFGGFLDSICDHCGDFAIYLGLLLPSLKRNSLVEVILIFVALFASIFGSHVRSRAGMVGIHTKTIGIFTRCERIFILVIGMLIGQEAIALWVLAIFNSFSALQRVIYALRVARNDKAIAIYRTLERSDFKSENIK